MKGSGSIGGSVSKGCWLASSISSVGSFMARASS